LPQRFSFANASGKFEQRRARIVVFDLDASISFLANLSTAMLSE
jgi:hypothetical protein